MIRPPRICAKAGCSRLTHRRHCDVHTPAPQTIGTAKTIVVCGPAGSGKTTFVHDHMRVGDILVDVDALASAISGQPWYEDDPQLLSYALAARDAVLDELAAPGRIRRAWIIGELPYRDQRERMRERFDAHVVVMETPPDECLRRIDGDDRRSNVGGDWTPRVRQWWGEYQPSDEDECVRPAIAGSVL